MSKHTNDLPPVAQAVGYAHGTAMADVTRKAVKLAELSGAEGPDAELAIAHNCLGMAAMLVGDRGRDWFLELCRDVLDDVERHSAEERKGRKVQ